MSRAEFLWVPPHTLVLASPASCRFVGPGEFVEMALAAFYAASRDQEPPEGEVWDSGDGFAWSGPEDFYLGLLRHLGMRLDGAALATGFAIERPWDEDDDKHAEFLDDVRLEAMAQGCAVLDLGAGAPPVSHPDRSGASYEEPLLIVQPGQELPQPGIAAMIDPAREVEA